MIETVDTILIRAPCEKVYEVASRVEEYGRFAPQYREHTILAREERRVVIRRRAKTLFTFEWTSEGTFEPPHRIVYRQVDGKLRGMITEWRFEPVPEGTQVFIVHRFEFSPAVVGRWVVYPLFIRPIAQSLLRNLKAHLEAAGEQGGENP
jgi:ribosome-associated toxin RatA of RatAB toxin-antitoxin module